MNQNGKIKTIGQDVTVRDVMDKVIQDMPYYRRSGGGLTLSGGECLVQADFSADVEPAAAQVPEEVKGILDIIGGEVLA